MDNILACAGYIYNYCDFTNLLNGPSNIHGNESYIYPSLDNKG